MNRRGVWKSLGNAAWILAILAIPVAAFVLHAFDQVRQVELRNLRNLGKAAVAIEELVGNAESTVRSLARQPRFACQFVSRQTRLELVEPQSCVAIQTGEVALDGGWKTRVREAGGVLQVVLAPPAAPESAPIVFAVRLDRLLGEIPFDRGLDLILMADGTGRVVSQLDGGATVAGRRMPVRVASLERAAREENEELKLPRSLQSTSVEPVAIAGAGYQLICQPLVIPGLQETRGTGESGRPASETSGPWTLCGVVDKDRSLRNSLAIAPHFISGLVLLVLLALFTWPLLKIASMTPRERFRFADVYFLLLGSWGAIMLATFVVVTYDTHLKLREVARDSLESLAGQVSERLMAEMADWHRQLGAFDVRLARDFAPGRSGQTDVTQVLDPEGAVPDWARPAVNEYFGSAFWMRPCDGRQFLKLTVRDANTPPVSVGSRDYFRRVQDGDLWTLPGAGAGRLFVQSFRSVTTGEFTAALSMPSGVAALHAFAATAEPTRVQMKDIFPDCDADQVVAAISGNPVSISHPVLPPGYGFAVVDRDGAVVFHSDGRRAVFENLYEEIEDADYVIAAVGAGTTLHLRSSYAAIPHDLFVRPLNEPPWTVVTFLDSRLLRTQHIETMMLGGFYILVHLAIYFLLTLGFIAVRGRATPVWLWPYLTFRPLDYAWLTWLLVITTIATALAVSMLGGVGALLCSLLAPIAPVLALTISPWVLRARNGDWLTRTVCLAGTTLAVLFSAALLFGAFGASGRGGEPVLFALSVALWLGGIIAWFYLGRTGGEGDVRWSVEQRLRYGRIGHMAAAFVIWVLVAVVPAWGYARFAVVEQLLVLARHDNVHSLLSLRARNAAVEDYYRGLDAPREFLGERTSLDGRDVYWSGLFWQQDAADAGEGACPRASAQATDADNDAARCPGYLSPAAAGSRAACGPDLAARIRCLLRSPERAAFPIYNEVAGQMRYLEQRGSELGQWRKGADAALLSYAPAIAGLEQPKLLRSRLPLTTPSTGWISLAGAALLVILLALWVRYGAARLFFGNITPARNEPYFGTLFAIGSLHCEPHGAPGVGRGLRRPTTAGWLNEHELAAWPAEVRDRHAAALRELEDGLSRREVLERLVEIGGVHYRSHWLSCSTDEQLVLVQLAKEGVANPKQEAAVRRLLARGLLVRDPVLRIMNRSFAVFVLREHAPDELARLERPQEGIGWKQVKWVLLAVLAVVATFLWTTQPAFIENAVKYLTAAAAAAAVLMKLVSATDRLSGGSQQ